MIRLEHVYKSFGSKRVLNDMNLHVERGESFVIMGPSGIGKSVTLKTIVGLVPADRGQVEVAGVNVTTASWEELCRVRSRIGYLFQSGALINWMTVAENVALPLLERTQMTRREIDHRVDDLLAQVEMLHARDLYPSAISGGMKKRAALARVLAGTPAIILYDEPTAGLDPIMTSTISQLIRDTQQKYQVTSIVVTHDIPCAFRVADRIGMVCDGKLVLVGTVEELQNSDHPVVSRFLRGEPLPTEAACAPPSTRPTAEEREG
ncbi:MAG: ATP-binding cassette domain-containing protein [Planctomycetota bacterium]